MEKQVGSIAVTESGVVVLLTSVDDSGEINGQIQTYSESIVLGPENTGARFRILFGKGLRVVSSAREVLRLLEQSGVDLKTKAERPNSSLSLEERVEKLERENTNLRAQMTSNA
jgi:hypothetical protein